ncbi:MAG: aminopeptidase N, partial [Pseudomonadota bacterium]|nr:aminopeptidase N [Pseudomonadota bacterium]
MDTATPKTIRLADYAPPAYLIDEVSLDVNLHPTATRVRSRLRIRPNPAFAGPARGLELDGESLQLEEIRLQDRKLASGDYETGKSGLVLPKTPAGPFEL